MIKNSSYIIIKIKQIKTHCQYNLEIQIIKKQGLTKDCGNLKKKLDKWKLNSNLYRIRKYRFNNKAKQRSHILEMELPILRWVKLLMFSHNLLNMIHIRVIFQEVYQILKVNLIKKQILVQVLDLFQTIILIILLH